MQRNKPNDQNDEIQPVPLTPAECNEVSGGYEDGYALHPGIEGKYTNLWTK